MATMPAMPALRAVTVPPVVPPAQLVDVAGEGLDALSRVGGNGKGQAECQQYGECLAHDALHDCLEPVHTVQAGP